MNTSTIEEIAYLLEQAKKNNQPKPIVFLGAGASKSGGIPLAGEIVNDILEKYPDNPKVKKLPEKDRTYSKLMECLLPAERNRLLKEYIDKAKVNVTHIYIAQLITQGYIDYVLTVNFDNLMLRALALFNNFPPTFDLAILKDLTTTSFPEKSVLYLHGQHHGLWLLNTKEEMAKVEEIVPPILNKITNGRAWIVIGYSGEDPIFNHIVKLGCFDNGLYWVGYNDRIPNEIVCTNLLNKPNTNGSLITGYDSDSFILALNSKIKNLSQPLIFDKPFSFLNEAIENIVDIDDKDHFKVVKQRLIIIKNQVNKAISQFDETNLEEIIILNDDLKKDKLSKEIINKIIDEDYSKLSELTLKAKKFNDIKLNNSLSNYYANFALETINLAKGKYGEEKEVLFRKALETYSQAIELSPDDIVYFNWAVALTDLAKIMEGEEQERLFQESFEKYAKAVELNPKRDGAFNNWAGALSDLAEIKEGEEQKRLFQESFEKYAKAVELNPKKVDFYNNWAIALTDLAKIMEGEEQERLFQESFEKYAKAVELNPDDNNSYYSWGYSLMEFGKCKKDGERQRIFLEAEEKLMRCIDNGGDVYNMACLKALMGEKEQALKLLEIALMQNEVSLNHVVNDEDFKNLKNGENFNNMVIRFKKRRHVKLSKS